MVGIYLCVCFYIDRYTMNIYCTKKSRKLEEFVVSRMHQTDGKWNAAFVLANWIDKIGRVSMVR